MSVDEVLIASEFDSAITTDALMEVGGFVFVEGVGSKVEDTVGKAGVLQYLFVGLSLHEGILNVLGHNKHRVVEVALVDTVHIYQAKHGEGSHGNHGLNLLLGIEPHADSTEQHIDKSAPCVGGEDGLTHGSDIGEYVGVLTKLGELVLRSIGLVEAGEEGIQQSRSAYKAEAGPELPHALSEGVGTLLKHTGKRHDSKERYGKLGNDENGGHGAELIV